MNRKEVGRLVQKYLQDQHPEGVAITVLAELIRKERNFWYVPVMPDSQPRKMHAYYEALAEVEGALEENDHLDVLLVPTVPEEAIVSQA